MNDSFLQQIRERVRDRDTRIPERMSLLQMLEADAEGEAGLTEHVTSQLESAAKRVRDAVEQLRGELRR